MWLSSGAKKGVGGMKKDPPSLMVGGKKGKAATSAVRGVKTPLAEGFVSARKGGAADVAKAAERHLPESVLYAANIHNNFIAGGYKEVCTTVHLHAELPQSAVECHGCSRGLRKRLCAPYPAAQSR